MARFRIDVGDATVLTPLKAVANTTDSANEQIVNKLKIVKHRALSNIKVLTQHTLIGGSDSLFDLMDPASKTKYLDQYSGYTDKINNTSVLLGISEKRKETQYFTPYGGTATDYLILRTQDATVTPAVITEFIDLSAIITVSQKKNILMTKVEGRSRTRKEYISGGDFIVNVSGVVLSDKAEVYPTEKVQALRHMLTTEDVLSVESPLLTRFGIDGLIVIDFKLTQGQGTSNQQAYSFTAVHEHAIEVRQTEEAEKLTAMQAALKAVNEWVAVDTLVTTTL